MTRRAVVPFARDSWTVSSASLLQILDLAGVLIAAEELQAGDLGVLDDLPGRPELVEGLLVLGPVGHQPGFLEHELGPGQASRGPGPAR